MKRFLMPVTTMTTLKKAAFTFLCCTVLMVFAAPAQTLQQIKADPGTNNPPPAGAILDLNGTPIPGGGNGTYQQYTVDFTAGIPNTAITFAFRDDPAFISFANASVTDLTAESGNLLLNGDFSLGTVGSTPVDWTYANIYGAAAGGIVESGSGFCYTYPFCWYDGAVQAYDAISQTIATTVGDKYHISFYVAENSHCVTDGGGGSCNFSDLSTNGDTTDTGGNGINVTVYAQAGLPSSGSQTQILQPGIQSIYTFGADKYKITPSPNSVGGESLTITFVPVLYSAFTPPPNFSNERCVPFADLSPTSPTAPLGSDVCAMYQADCSVGGVHNGGDCTTLLYTVLESYDLPPNLPAIGGPDGLIVHGVGCPNAGVNAEDIFYSYSVTRTDPTTTVKGTGTGSCFEVTYTPGAPPITGAGTTIFRSQFVGWESPIVDNELNMVKAGSTRPLAFQLFDTLGNPVTTLTYCPNMSGVGCTAPWVNLSSFGIVCPSGTPVNTSTNTTTLSSAGNSGFKNNGGGNYQLNWQTQKSWKGYCANVQATFDNGLVVVPATLGFQFN